jgi:hypothetical protein
MACPNPTKNPFFCQFISIYNVTNLEKRVFLGGQIFLLVSWNKPVVTFICKILINMPALNPKKKVLRVFGWGRLNVHGTVMP